MIMHGPTPIDIDTAYSMALIARDALAHGHPPLEGALRTAATEPLPSSELLPWAVVVALLEQLNHDEDCLTELARQVARP